MEFESKSIIIMLIKARKLLERVDLESLFC